MTAYLLPEKNPSGRYEWEAYSHLKSSLQTMSTPQIMAIERVADIAPSIGWSCSDTYSYLLEEAEEDAVVREFVRALDRETIECVNSMRVLASNMVNQWIKDAPPSPSMIVLKELVLGLNSDEKGDLLWLLTEIEILQTERCNTISIEPDFDDNGDPRCYTVFQHRTDNVVDLDPNPGIHNEVEILIKMLRQFCDESNDDDADAVVKAIVEEVIDLLPKRQLAFLKNAFANGVQEFFWTGEGIPIFFEDLYGDGNYRLQINEGFEETCWDLDSDEARELGNAFRGLNLDDFEDDALGVLNRIGGPNDFNPEILEMIEDLRVRATRGQLYALSEHFRCRQGGVAPFFWSGYGVPLELSEAASGWTLSIGATEDHVQVEWNDLDFHDVCELGAAILQNF